MVMVNERDKKLKNAHKAPKKSKPTHNVEEVDSDIILGRRKSVTKRAPTPKLVLAHELLRSRILRDGELQPYHIKEVNNTLPYLLKKTFLELYLPVVDKSSRVIIRKINDDNIGVFAKRLIYNETILTELFGKNSEKVTNHLDNSIPKYKSVMEKKITYKRKGQTVTSVNNFYLIGLLAFANHSCSTHLNAITVDEKLKNISLVHVIEKNQQITYDYGYNNDYCIDCNNNKK